MYQELIEEAWRALALDWWPCASVTVGGMESQALESPDIRCAFCFAVCQSDKVRRCEDYKRSGRNLRVRTFDVPFHHGIQTYVELSKAFHEIGQQSMAWCQDLSAAYRQFAVADPNDCFSVLCCPY